MTDQESKGGSRWKWLATRLLLVLVGLVLADVAVRLGLTVFGDGYNGGQQREQWTSRVARDFEERGESDQANTDPLLAPFIGGDFMPHPYVGFQARHDDEEFVAHWRAQQALGEARDQIFSVLIVGGSVSEHFGDPVNGGLEPLREKLAADPRFAGRKLMFFTHGRAAYKQPMQLMWLSWLISLGCEPDLLINLDGFNELALAALNAENGAFPLYPTMLHWSRVVETGAGRPTEQQRALELIGEQVARIGLDWNLEWSAVLGSSVQAVLRKLDRESSITEARVARDAAESNQAVFGPPWNASLEETLELAVDGWARSSRALNDLCRARGIPYLHVLQPTLFDEGSKPLTDEERTGAKIPETAIRSVELGYPLLRAAGARLEKEGVPFLDASGVFAKEERTIYFDACHFVRPGTVILGEAIAGAL